MRIDAFVVSGLIAIPLAGSAQAMAAAFDRLMPKVCGEAPCVVEGLRYDGAVLSAKGCDGAANAGAGLISVCLRSPKSVPAYRVVQEDGRERLTRIGELRITLSPWSEKLKEEFIPSEETQASHAHAQAPAPERPRLRLETAAIAESAGRHAAGFRGAHGDNRDSISGGQRSIGLIPGSRDSSQPDEDPVREAPRALPSQAPSAASRPRLEHEPRAVPIPPPAVACAAEPRGARWLEAARESGRSAMDGLRAAIGKLSEAGSFVSNGTQYAIQSLAAEAMTGDTAEMGRLVAAGYRANMPWLDPAKAYESLSDGNRRVVDERARRTRRGGAGARPAAPLSDYERILSLKGFGRPHELLFERAAGAEGLERLGLYAVGTFGVLTHEIAPVLANPLLLAAPSSSLREVPARTRPSSARGSARNETRRIGLDAAQVSVPIDGGSRH